MTSRYRRHGIPAGPHYLAVWRVLTRKPRRRDALDCPRGSMVDDGATWDAEAHVDRQRVRAVVAAVVSEMPTQCRVAWAVHAAGGDLTDVSAAIGRSRDRARQVVLDVRNRVAARITAQGTDHDGRACGWERNWNGGWYVDWYRGR